MEAELFSRIRNLEAQLAHGIPPQPHPGEYGQLVRENFESALSVDHYRKALSIAFFKVQIMEPFTGFLFDYMITEPRLDVILNQSLYNDIRSEAYDFLEEKVQPVNPMRKGFQRKILEGLGGIAYRILINRKKAIL